MILAIEAMAFRKQEMAALMAVMRQNRPCPRNKRTGTGHAQFSKECGQKSFHARSVLEGRRGKEGITGKHKYIAAVLGNGITGG